MLCVQTQDEQYRRDVLALVSDSDEEALDTSLRAEAEELGLSINGPKSSAQDSRKAPSMDTAVSERARRSGSICSQSSRSTGLTSHYSDMSRKTPLNVPQSIRGPSEQPSHTTRSSFAGEQSFRHSIAVPIYTQSTPSLPATAPNNPPKKSFRRLRGFSLLGKHRNSSESSVTSAGCPHCPKDAASKRRALHALPCGHRFCAAALRMKINAEKGRGLYPSCCGVPVPGVTIQHAMTRVEREDFLDHFAKWDDGGSRSASVVTGAADTGSSASVSPEREHSPEQDLQTARLATSAKTVQDYFDTVPELRELQAACEAQCQRFRLWTIRARALAAEEHTTTLAAARHAHETALNTLLSTHALALTDAEDKQVSAESALREFHAQEHRINVTALKQQEAYCAGIYSNGQPHGRVITDLDRAELQKSRRARDTMAGRQESQINVLRGEQGRRIRARIQRQEKEVEELDAAQEREVQALERRYVEEGEEFGRRELERRGRLEGRWRVKMMILLRRAGIEEEEAEGCRGFMVAWDGAVDMPPPVPEKDVRRGAPRPRWDSMLADVPGQV